MPSFALRRVPAQDGHRVLDVGAHERLREVDEMAHLAEQAPALAPVEIPVAVRDPARGDPVDHQLRRLHLRQYPLRGLHGRRPAPVEAERELAPGAPPGLLHLVEPSQVSASGFSHHTSRPAARARLASSACTSCGVAITTRLTSGSSMTAAAPETAFSNPCRSAARRAETPLAVATATKRSKPASRKAGSSVPVENAPAPIQPTPGAERSAGPGLQAHRLVRRLPRPDR